VLQFCINRSAGTEGKLSLTATHKLFRWNKTIIFRTVGVPAPATRRNYKMETRCGIILLAAGSSSRLGEPKQSLVYNQSTLLEHSIQVALESMADQVITVLGANAETIKLNIIDEKLSVIVNELWQEGIASSIRCGLQYLLERIPVVQSALFMVCDQPYISAALLNKLVTLQRQTGAAIVASEYAGTTGIPAIFDETLFADLLQLKGDAGAKKLIMQQPGKIAAVSFPLGDIDIDTAADYSRLQKNKKD
jgi:molybdenum cofactor cytidylyltransferase